MTRNKTAEVSISETSAVWTCDPVRDTLRTFDSLETLCGMKNLLQIFDAPKEPEMPQIAAPGVPQWKYNLKNQNRGL